MFNSAKMDKKLISVRREGNAKGKEMPCLDLRRVNVCWERLVRRWSIALSDICGAQQGCSDNYVLDRQKM